ncbi:MAG: glutamine cyclotransferase [Flavobacteriaceae bacterium]|jgi:glutamine cyclotransferase
MKKKVIIGLIILVGATLLIMPLINSNSVEDDSPLAEFSFDQDNLAMHIGDKIDLKAKILQPIVKLELLLDNSVVDSWDSPKGSVTYNLKGEESLMGAHRLTLRATDSNGNTDTDYLMLRVLSDIEPEVLAVEIVKTHPHLSSSFTQGLEFYNGRLFEGTGDPGRQGKTNVAEVELESGKWIEGKFMSLGPTRFGEGITILNDKLYQLTWQSQVCYVYDVNNVHGNISEFQYIGEGWGLCNDGKSLIMSNGSERITFRNPDNFEIERTLEVYDNTGPISNLNELEFIDGLIYANVWQTSIAVVIDPRTGKVLKSIDASTLVNGTNGQGGVLNGIAYNIETGKTYMTGKYWTNMYEVNFVPK